MTTINWDDGLELYIAAECSIHLLLGERYYFCRRSYAKYLVTSLGAFRSCAQYAPESTLYLQYLKFLNVLLNVLTSKVKFNSIQLYTDVLIVFTFL